MGDGGVACMPLQHIMERFPIADNTLCGVNNNDTNANDNDFSSNPVQLPQRKKKRMVKVKRIVSVKKRERKQQLNKKQNEKSESLLEKTGEASGESDRGGHSEQKEEVEEGELGTLKSPTEVENGELLTHRWAQRCEIERGEITCEKWRKDEGEKAETASTKWQKGDIEKGDMLQDRARKEMSVKKEIGSWKEPRDEIEKGEFIPDKWHKVDIVKDEYSHGKLRRYELGRDKGWKFDRERTLPSWRYSNDDLYRRSRGGGEHNKTFSRWDGPQERSTRISSKIVDEDSTYNSEHNNGKNHERDYSFGNRLKRHGTDPNSSVRKHYGDYASSKSRKVFDDISRSAFSEHHSRPYVDRFYRNSSSLRNSSSDKYSSRHHDSPLSSRLVHERHERSPGHSERSPLDRRYYEYRERSPSRRERSPCAREKSPYDRSRHHEHRNQSPSHVERSPLDRVRHRDRTPSCLEPSPLDRNKPNRYRETGRKGGSSDKRTFQYSYRGQEEKLNHIDSSGKDSQLSVKEFQDKNDTQSFSSLDEKNAPCESLKEETTLSPSIIGNESLQADVAPHEELLSIELLSMEEDMDICNTPPHVPVVADSSTGKWVYLDYHGVDCGPSKLCDLKALMKEGALLSDHLIRHLDCDRWVTVENAASPLVSLKFQPIVSEAVTQLVSPPEPSGNLLVDAGDTAQPTIKATEEKHTPFPQPLCCADDPPTNLIPPEDFRIDERVGALLDGFTILPGRELEIVGEALQMTFEHEEPEGCVTFGGFSWHLASTMDEDKINGDEVSRSSDIKFNETGEINLSASSEKDHGFISGDIDEWFSGRWSCKGGDWKRDDEAGQDRHQKKKIVLSDGFPLCQMPKSGYEDPRWHHKDDLYYPSHNRSLDLPPWAFSCVEETSQIKLTVGRGVKGTTLPVVRINACVVKEHGSFLSESRPKVRGRERHSSRTARPQSASSDVKRASTESDSQSVSANDQELQSSWKGSTPTSTHKDRLCTVYDLQLQLGLWYYLDGAGHERGPSSFPELQLLVDKGTIPTHSSVFRKFDKVWVPVSSILGTSLQENYTSSSDSSIFTLPQSHDSALGTTTRKRNSFHSLHPQFIGYTCGKLHELVMKSYKSREFAAAINEVLDPWINSRQPKNESQKHASQKSEGNARPNKRSRVLADDSEEECEVGDVHFNQNEELTFEDLCGKATFYSEESASSETELASWGLLDGFALARIFHFLRSDMKSLALSAVTCKHWRAAIKFYKDVSRQVDLSSVGPNCTDSVIWNIMNGYSKEMVNSMVLNGCTNISCSALEEILRLFPSVSSIDIRGCSQFGELIPKFPGVNWVKNRSSHDTRTFKELHCNIKSQKQQIEKVSLISKNKALVTNMDDFGDLKGYFDSVDKRDSAIQSFGRSLYKRTKLFDARRSSSILSRDARIRRWAIKKSENGYKRMEEFLASSLKDIMKENTFDFFVPKVTEIDRKMKRGYYISHGLGSVKEDIRRMCRDAIKAKNQGGAGDMNHIITLLIQLAARLEEGSKITSAYEREELIKSWQDDLPAGFSSSASKYKKKLNKLVTGRKNINKSNGNSFTNGSSDYGEYASDREIKKRLSKLNRKSLDSGSETHDDLDQSSEDGKSNSASTSDTESDLDFRSEVRSGDSRGDDYCTADEACDSTTEEREWGARMTKASLVPPVTRKYEVIDQYVIVADEEDVQRKMRVSLPEDYTEKLSAQKIGIEELDMELPEVKEYKPRKTLGVEVIEQEVYGIDPYTHNLLLDSMPDELDWPLQDKHAFIEDVLLCTLNKQVRHFTGSGSTPMVYPLKPVVEEIKEAAHMDLDLRTLKMCQGIMRAINHRPDDKYVAYRKGLGVVCNKEGGFGNEDFVVEFLGEVYPVWKWFEKQDGIRSLQKNTNDPAPEFYNINLERPKGDAEGYDLVVVDAMHKANYASRICHSCRPNCEAKVTAVDGQYQIGIYSVRKIQHGEEVTFDYNSVTESKEEYEASVCLCGSQVCRGSYLNLTGEGAFQKVLKEWHGILDRHQLMLEACELNSFSEEDYLDLGRAGLGSCLLGGLPNWMVAYSARLVRFINFERTKLPEEILKHNLEEKRKYFSEICFEVEKSDAEVQAEGVYNQRLQNLAVTLDKVRYVMRCLFGDPKKAPPPLERLSSEAVVSFLWKGDGSLVEELLQCMSPHVEEDILNDLKSKIVAHDPSAADDILKELQKSLLWLRDEVRNLPCTYKCRNDAAADLIHIYAYTKCFFRVREYKTVTSSPVYISPLDLGPKYADKIGAEFQEYHKTYGENYCLGQLIFWHNQTNPEPDSSLARLSRGCLSLPDIGSFYAKVQKPSRHRVYGPKTVKFMLSRMEKQSQKAWPKDQIWSFKSSAKVFGSPMLDAVLKSSCLDREMVQWLKHRPAIFHAMWDR